MNDTQFPLTLPAIKVVQPLGEFYVVAINARLLRQITHIDPTRIASSDRQKFLYKLIGAQRISSVPRAKQISHYIDTVESAFPNSIILAANYINNGVLQEDGKLRWRIQPNDSGCHQLVIPSNRAMASVIDGQHRLLGFDYCRDERRDMDLLCAVYLDLPHAYQAYLFATININQRKVDKSLAYEQFGYNLDEEEKKSWSPDKLAVFLARKLNLDPQSPFHGHIKIAPIQDEELLPDSKGEWKISTAALVEGIIKLISTSPSNDRDQLHKQSVYSRSRETLGEDASPLRNIYLSSNDEAIYKLLEKYFSEAKAILWDKANERSYIRKTVGVQALFDVLRFLAQEQDSTLESIPEKAQTVFNAVSNLDFSDPVYQASGKGRVIVKNSLLLFSRLITLSDLPDSDKGTFTYLQAKYDLPPVQ